MGPGILIVGNHPPPPGGVPRHIEFLAPALAKAGWNVHVLSSGHDGSRYMGNYWVHKPPRSVRLAAVLRDLTLLRWSDAWALRRLLPRDFRWWLRYLGMAAIGRRLARKYDLRLVSAYGLYAGGPPGMLLAREGTARLVTTNFGEAYSMKVFLQRNRWLVEGVIKESARLLAISRHCADSYLELGMRPDVQVIPYGIDLGTFKRGDGRKSARSKMAIPPSAVCVGFVGRMVPDMGLDVFLTAMDTVLQARRKCHCMIVGRRGTLHQAALDLASKFPGRVHVRADVSVSELVTTYEAADLVVAPTQGNRACSSLAALEAMAFGIPVVAASVGGVPEAVEHMRSGLLVPPKEPAALAAAIGYLVDGDEARQVMGEYARTAVRRDFDADRTHERLDFLFREVLNA